MQDPALLARITQYSYDLEDETFQAYCTARGVFHVAGERGSRRWLYMSDTRKARKQFLADRAFQYAQTCDGARYKYTPEEMETSWQVILLGRAALEDAWDLYRSADPAPRRERGEARAPGKGKMRKRAPRQADLF